MKRRGFSQAALSKFVGVSQKTISDWCAGKFFPSAENLPRLAAALGMPPGFVSSYRPDVVAGLSRAIRPGEFLSDAEETALREAERYAREAPLREAAAQKEAVRQQEAARLQEAEDLRTVRQALRDPALKTDWRRQFAVAGNRCILCATPLRCPGICVACMAGDRDDD